MSNDETAPAPDDAADPTDLPGIGPATAAVIEEASFTADDIAAGTVSYRMLIEAGVNPGVAARLRREYSLVWSFRWHFGGDDLPKRAAQVRSLEAPERSWISESPAALDGETADLAAWQEWIDRSFAAEPPTVCPRCGSSLERFALEESVRVQCGACGYVAVEVIRDDPPTPPESWAEALRRFYEHEQGHEHDGGSTGDTDDGTIADDADGGP